MENPMPPPNRPPEDRSAAAPEPGEPHNLGAGNSGSSGCCASDTGNRCCVLARPTTAVEPDFEGRFHAKDKSSSNHCLRREQSTEELEAKHSLLAPPNTESQ